MLGRSRTVDLVQVQISALDERIKIARLEERVGSLHELMEAKFVTFRTLLDSQADKVKLALDAAQTAIDKAEIADEKARDRLQAELKQRFESVNEFRAQQRDVIAGFMPRAEFDQFRQMYTEQHVILRDQLAEQIADLKGRMDRNEGRQGGVGQVWGVIVAVAGIAVAIGALVFRNM